MNTLIVDKSKFIAFAYEVYSKEEIATKLNNIKISHQKAKHICYAYITDNGRTAKMFDDGEPKGSAGKPLFNLLNMKNKQNFLIVVVRYFGGKKLGISKLTRTYVSAAKTLIK